MSALLFPPSTARRHGLALAALLLLLTTIATAAPVKSMPPYRGTKGDAVDDPARMKQETREFDAAYKAYRQAAREFRSEVREFITDEIRKRQRKISGNYQTQIDKIDAEQSKLRKEAIARLESFIFRHRRHDRYTPDAMFRLAELYYEDSIATYNYSQDHFDEQQDLYNRGKLLDPPVEKDKEFSRSIALYKYLHWVPTGTRMKPLSGKLAGVVMPKRWPNYRHADAALYLQGYCEAEMGEYDKAIATLSSLERHYPKSKYRAEAWLRVGELYFDNNEFEQAADAYRRAAATKNPKMYGLALYKLGWAHFQMYRYPEAVAWFQKLIEYYDENKAKGTKQGADLRKEAIEYLAKSLAEPSWDDDGCEDFGGADAKGDCIQVDPRLRMQLYVSGVLEPKTEGFPDWMAAYEGPVLDGLQRNLKARAQVRKGLMNGKPYVREVLITYGNTLLDQAEDDYYRQGVLVLAHVVDTWPLSREAQFLQKKIIRAVDLLAAAAPSFELDARKDPTNIEARLGLELARAAQERQITERRKYLRMFSPGSPWHERWGKDKDLARQVEEMMNQVRMNFAKLIHSQAQTLRAVGKTKEAMAKYLEAAKEYEKLLQDDPSSNKAYELTWTLADVYFFAGKRCDAMRDKAGEFRRFDAAMIKKIKGASAAQKKQLQGLLIPWPADKIELIKTACGSMQKALHFYDAVRDWKGAKGKDDEGKIIDHTEEAAYSSIDVTERIINARAAYAFDDPERLPTRALPGIRPDAERDQATIETNRKAMEKSQGQLKDFKLPRQEVPKAVVMWIKSVDDYIAGKYKNKDEPNREEKLALRAAELLYKNRNFDPWKEQPYKNLTPEFFSSRMRFRDMITKYPKTRASVEAAKDLLTSYRMEIDVDNMKAVAKWLADKGLAPPETIKKINATLRTIFLGDIAFKAEQANKSADLIDAQAKAATDPDEAFKLHKKARAAYKNAAQEYRRLQHETDKTKVKLQSLLNAVALYYSAQEWDELFGTLKEAEEMLRGINAKASTSSSERKKNVERLLGVLSRRAQLQFRFFRIPEAIANYREVYKLNPDGQKGGDALVNASLLAFRNSNWNLAIELNEEVVRKFKNVFKRQAAKDAANQRIVDAYKAKGNIEDYIRALYTYIDRYKNDRVAQGNVFSAYAKIANLYRGRGKKTKEFKVWMLILKEFDRRKLEKNGSSEATAAAEAQFRLMEPAYDKYMAKKLKVNKRLKPSKQMAALQKEVKLMMDIALGAAAKKKNATTGQMEMVRTGGMYKAYFEKVATYGSRNWSYAAFLYRAQMLVHLARTIYAAPTPEDLSEDEEEQLAEILETFGGQIENRAMKSLELALKDAEAKGVVNEWVTKLRVAINRYKPAEYPLLKEAKRMSKFPLGTAPGAEKELR
ncbi:MAG: tetratricopeptide repeat protein [Myxococcales bacterium]|nr:tetratricopeptide repeat protein [Myxococcales bacterium]